MQELRGPRYLNFSYRSIADSSSTLRAEVILFLVGYKLYLRHSSIRFYWSLPTPISDVLSIRDAVESTQRALPACTWANPLVVITTAI
jgi:hypothetical protein